MGLLKRLGLALGLLAAPSAAQAGVALDGASTFYWVNLGTSAMDLPNGDWSVYWHGTLTQHNDSAFRFLYTIANNGAANSPSIMCEMSGESQGSPAAYPFNRLDSTGGRLTCQARSSAGQLVNFTSREANIFPSTAVWVVLQRDSATGDFELYTLDPAQACRPQLQNRIGIADQTFTTATMNGHYFVVGAQGFSGNTTSTFSSGATSITVGSAAGIVLNSVIVGPGFANNTTVTSVSGTTIGLSIATTANETSSQVFTINPNTVQATTTSASGTGVNPITVTSAAGMAVGQVMLGTNLPYPAIITNIAGTSITLSQAPTGTLGTVRTYQAPYLADSWYELGKGNFAFTLTDMTRLCFGEDPVSGLGKTLTMRLGPSISSGATSITNSVGTDVLLQAGSPASATDPTAPTPPQLGLYDVQPNTVFGAPQGGNATLPVSFWTTDSAPQVDYQTVNAGTSAVIIPWTTVTPTYQTGGTTGARGTFNVALPWQGGRMAQWQLRETSNHSVTSVGSNAWGVGIQLGMFGQSEQQRVCDATSSPFTGGPALHTNADGVVNVGINIYGDWQSTSGYYGCNDMVNTVASVSGQSVGYVDLATGGQTLAYFNNAGSGGTGLPFAITSAMRAGCGGVSCSANYMNGLFWQQGSSDIGQVTGTEASYTTNYASFRTLALAQFNAHGTLGAWGAKDWFNKGIFAAGFSWDNMNQLRQAYQTIFATYGGDWQGGRDDDIIRSDSLHESLTSPSGAQTLGHRAALGALRWLGLASHGGQGPTIAGCEWVDTTHFKIHWRGGAGTALHVGQSGTLPSDLVLFQSGTSSITGTATAFSNGSPNLTLSASTSAANGAGAANIALPNSPGPTISSGGGTASLVLSQNFTANLAAGTNNASMSFFTLATAQPTAVSFTAGNTITVTLGSAAAENEDIYYKAGYYNDNNATNPWPASTNGNFFDLYDNYDTTSGLGGAQPNGQGGLPLQRMAYPCPTWVAPTPQSLGQLAAVGSG